MSSTDKTPLLRVLVVAFEPSASGSVLVLWSFQLLSLGPYSRTFSVVLSGA